MGAGKRKQKEGKDGREEEDCSGWKRGGGLYHLLHDLWLDIHVY